MRSRNPSCCGMPTWLDLIWCATLGGNCASEPRTVKDILGKLNKPFLGGYNFCNEFNIKAVETAFSMQFQHCWQHKIQYESRKWDAF